MNCCNAFTGECEQGHGCPVRESALPADVHTAAAAAAAKAPPKAPATAPAQTTCCHRPHCTDAACPGRADRPPHPAQLHNSDGSCPGYDPNQTIQPDWFDDVLFWLQMAFIAMTAAALCGVAAGYFWA